MTATRGMPEAEVAGEAHDIPKERFAYPASRAAKLRKAYWYILIPYIAIPFVIYLHGTADVYDFGLLAVAVVITVFSLFRIPQLIRFSKQEIEVSEHCLSVVDPEGRGIDMRWEDIKEVAHEPRGSFSWVRT